MSKATYFVRVATLQKGGILNEKDSEALSWDRARRLFLQLKENGRGMHLELWSNDFGRCVDKHTHKDFKPKPKPKP